MSDIPQTPFAVALRLAEAIAFAEGKQLRITGNPGSPQADRQYTLQLYKECLAAVGAEGPVFTPRGA